MNNKLLTYIVMNRSNFQLARSFNNHGASLMAAGDSLGAIGKFSDALKITRQIIMGQTGKNTIITNSNEQDVSAPLVLEECMIQSCIMADAQRNDGGYDGDTSVTFIPQKATLIPETAEPQINQDYANTMSVIVIFNLALAHQTRAYESAGEASSQQSSEMLLKKSIKFYQLSLSLYLEGSPATSGDSLLFLMAVMNNIALANHSLHDVEASEHFFEQLLSLMMVRLDIGGQADSHHSVLFNSFVRNVMHLLSPHTPAPAA